MSSPPEPPLSEYQQTVQDFIALLQALRAWRKVINLYYQGRLIGRATVNFAGLMQKSSRPRITIVDHFDDDPNAAIWRKTTTPPAPTTPAVGPALAEDYAAAPMAAPPRIVHRAFPPDPAKPRQMIDWTALCNTPFKLPDRPEAPLCALSPEAMMAGLAALDAIGTAPVPPIPFEPDDLTELLKPYTLATSRFTDGGFLDGPGRFGTFLDNTPLEAVVLPSSETSAPAGPAADGGFSGYGPAILGLPPILRSLVGFGPDPLDGQSPAAAVLNLAGNLAVGAAEGAVNLVPKTAVSLINTIYEGSRLEALGEGGQLTPDEFDQIRAGKATDLTGTIFTPANPVQALGETFGEFAAPFFLGGAVRSLGRLAVEGGNALFSSFTELNMAKASAKIEAGLIEATKPLMVAPNTGEILTSSVGNAAGPAAANRGLIFVSENLGEPTSAAQQAARDFEAGTEGAFSDIATRQRQVPALQYDNPNPNGVPFIKFDGFSQLDDGTIELIDAKTRLVPYATSDGAVITESVIDSLTRQSAALAQNPGFRGVLEFPTQAAANEAQTVLNELKIRNIGVRVRLTE
jgi:hypothetical protein